MFSGTNRTARCRHAVWCFTNANIAFTQFIPDAESKNNSCHVHCTRHAYKTQSLIGAPRKHHYPVINAIPSLPHDLNGFTVLVVLFWILISALPGSRMKFRGIQSVADPAFSRTPPFTHSRNRQNSSASTSNKCSMRRPLQQLACPRPTPSP